ncbi:hypothetical protein C2869_03065 [Saccharobesus litoralis]|uniref:Uncharacterized protein n=1 Tax=Saccharobesus litoralis TaxID=2172099 RepID=A0A2S0VMQ4_9ALTE|nr:hypothetical protein C2869_03065 [Saccharobesus litoralis]
MWFLRADYDLTALVKLFSVNYLDLTMFIQQKSLDPRMREDDEGIFLIYVEKYRIIDLKNVSAQNSKATNNSFAK